jgi:hypothetical protein
MVTGQSDIMSTFTTFRRMSNTLDSKIHQRFASGHLLEELSSPTEATVSTAISKSAQRRPTCVTGRMLWAWLIKRKISRQKNPGAIVHSGTPQRKSVRTAKSLPCHEQRLLCTLSHNSCDIFQRSALNMHDNWQDLHHQLSINVFIN